jgi:hypothetical protein
MVYEFFKKKELHGYHLKFNRATSEFHIPIVAVAAKEGEHAALYGEFWQKVALHTLENLEISSGLNKVLAESANDVPIADEEFPKWRSAEDNNS